MMTDKSTTTTPAKAEEIEGEYYIKLDMNVLNHLGMSLYSNTPAVLTEIISNAWDADAANVTITLDKDKGEVLITDDGHGMSDLDIKNRFLNVGYARRDDKRSRSDSNNRQVMGRKGIGKLAMFSLAKKIQVTSKIANSQAIAFEIDVTALQDAIKSKVPYKAKPIISQFNQNQGTQIKLFELKKSISRTEGYLRKKLARRFSIIGEAHKFEVVINNTPISFADRDFLKELQFLWEIGVKDPNRNKECKSLKRNGVLDGIINFQGQEYDVRGYIGSVLTPNVLKRDPEVPNNTVAIISNGRIFDEDILPEFGSAKHFTNYLVGEIEIDLLDANDKEDMATSSRQKLQQDDNRYPVLKSYFTKILSQIDKDWDNWRREIGAEEAEEESPAIKEWFASLRGLEEKAARKVIGQINTMSFSGENPQLAKKTVLKNTVLAFEKLRIQDNLDRLDSEHDIHSKIFKDIFSSIDDIEATLYHQITSQRLAVIDRFQSITDDNELEKVVQEYLYDHLWLLDPSWERASGSQQIERTLTAELKQVHQDAEKGARLDIEYKTIAGQHIIIEMKRPKVKPSIEELVVQGRKYLVAVKQWYHNNPASCPMNGKIPDIEVIFLLGKAPSLPPFEGDDYNAKQLESIHARIMTYTDLITQSKQAYNEYVASRSESDRIKNIIDKI
ncbi:ATP-binding protein [Shewanella sp. NKUCC06_TVS]|uniref:BbrUII/HgiDII family restriction enzyme n=1 Tax=Shewanella sp. NKUCC06_TVS TaxID=2842128 RepID=UPI001C5B0471|nr:ATP-binding protein [Shewanella sp. NKUCC06_TVS]MBW3530354.1 ATP-binding protein [Shewanella sp. NKUCC06_TVS]